MKEITTIKVTKESLRDLRIIAAYKGESMMAVFEEVIKKEKDKIVKSEKKSK